MVKMDFPGGVRDYSGSTVAIVMAKLRSKRLLAGQNTSCASATGCRRRWASICAKYSGWYSPTQVVEIHHGKNEAVRLALRVDGIELPDCVFDRGRQLVEKPLRQGDAHAAADHFALANAPALVRFLAGNIARLDFAEHGVTGKRGGEVRGFALAAGMKRTPVQPMLTR